MYSLRVLVLDFFPRKGVCLYRYSVFYDALPMMVIIINDPFLINS